MRVPRAIFFLAPALAASFVDGAMAFNPQGYEKLKHTASCKAIRRAPAQEPVDIKLNYVDINPDAPSTIIMVHGWPSVWSTWARQIMEFENDYHLIVPNLRGFGDSEHPGDVRSSGTMGDMVSDLVCILQNAGVKQAICMGHDWGSGVCYEAARARPDIFIGVVGAVVPYIASAGPHTPVKKLLTFLPKLSYQLFFDGKLEEAVTELDADVKRTMRATLRTVDSPPPNDFLASESTFMGAWDNVEIPPVPFFSPEEEDYYVQEMAKHGFRNTLQFYTHENRQQSWETAHNHGNYTIPQPVLAIYPTEDPVADWMLLHNVVKTAQFIPKLTIKLSKGAHWVHLENPKQFNSLVRGWLENNFAPDGSVADHHDEL